MSGSRSWSMVLIMLEAQKGGYHRRSCRNVVAISICSRAMLQRRNLVTLTACLISASFPCLADVETPLEAEMLLLVVVDECGHRIIVSSS